MADLSAVLVVASGAAVVICDSQVLPMGRKGWHQRPKRRANVAAPDRAAGGDFAATGSDAKMPSDAGLPEQRARGIRSFAEALWSSDYVPYLRLEELGCVEVYNALCLSQHIGGASKARRGREVRC